ncbi:MAG: ABC transporter permease, partial [Spirochaetales bacterium]|nr:ABC transporter permease [Spirochaetales bacterium]
MNSTETLNTINAPAAESPLAEHWHQLKRSKTAMAGLIIILAFILIAVFAPLLAPMDPVAQNIEMRKTAPFVSEYILGTDDLGRDMLSRLIYGARISMTIGVIAVGIALFFGILIGVISGYYGGMVDKVIQRLVDIMLAFPYILLTIVIVAVLGPSLTNAMVAIGISQIPRYIRIVRASVMAEKESDYVMAERALGASDFELMFLSILPNCLAPISV